MNGKLGASVTKSTDTNISFSLPLSLSLSHPTNIYRYGYSIEPLKILEHNDTIQTNQMININPMYP